MLLFFSCSDDHKSNTGPEITPDHIVIQGVITDTTTDSILYLTGVAVKLIYNTTTLEQRKYSCMNF